MVALASKCDGFLGVESSRSKDGLGITVSYWRDLESIRKWKEDARHKVINFILKLLIFFFLLILTDFLSKVAQEKGKKEFYDSFTLRVAKVERAKL